MWYVYPVLIDVNPLANEPCAEDICLTSIFFRSWMCKRCGGDICCDCYLILTRYNDITPSEPGFRMRLPLLGSKASDQAVADHQMLSCTKGFAHFCSDLIPISRFSSHELDREICNVQAVLASFLPEVVVEPSSPVYSISYPSDPSEVLSLPLRTFSYQDMTDDAFHREWGGGQPLVVSGVDAQSEIQWTPDYFLSKSAYASQICRLVDCQNNKEITSTVFDFFGAFGKTKADLDRK